MIFAIAADFTERIAARAAQAQSTGDSYYQKQ
jgi:hypothetical protein